MELGLLGKDSPGHLVGRPPQQVVFSHNTIPQEAPRSTIVNCSHEEKRSQVTVFCARVPKRVRQGWIGLVHASNSVSPTARRLQSTRMFLQSEFGALFQDQNTEKTSIDICVVFIFLHECCCQSSQRMRKSATEEITDFLSKTQSHKQKPIHKHQNKKPKNSTRPTRPGNLVVSRRFFLRALE